MTEQETKRRRIHDFLDAQISNSEIVKTVRRIKRAKDTGSDPKRKAGSGGLNKKRDEDFVSDLLARINADPTTSMRRHARDLEVDLVEGQLP
ncbi:MAG: hypothetical protein OIF58_00185 [Cohaesibacter sp.]|nr:hypothetical protein [Cohaesibacter sp.]